MKNAAVVPVKRLENIPPHIRRNQKRILRTPVVHERNSVDIGPRPHFHFAAVKFVKHFNQREKLFRAVSEVYKYCFRSPKELQSLKRPGLRAGHHEPIRFCTRLIDPAEIGII